MIENNLESDVALEEMELNISNSLTGLEDEIKKELGVQRWETFAK